MTERLIIEAIDARDTRHTVYFPGYSEMENAVFLTVTDRHFRPRG
jgi:hypothetical protein